jgi:toxin ParE1/3/4
MPEYRLSRAAANDVVGIYLHGLERFGPGQADRYHTDMAAAFAFLARHPLAARLREEIAPPVRVHPFGVHLIVYEQTGGGILVLRIRHGRED